MQRLFFDSNQQSLYSLNENCKLKLLYEFPQFHDLQWIGVSNIDRSNCTIQLHFIDRLSTCFKQRVFLFNYFTNLIAIVDNFPVNHSLFLRYYSNHLPRNL